MRNIGRKEKGFTLLELLVVLAITGSMMGLGVMGVLKLRQVILISSTAKELAINLKKARRYALDNVVTSRPATATAYYIKIDDNDYSWGECDSSGCSDNSIKSTQYGGVDVDGCDAGVTEMKYYKFMATTGEFIINNDNENATDPTLVNPCTIIISTSSFGVSSQREVEIDLIERTIHMK